MRATSLRTAVLSMVLSLAGCSPPEHRVALSLIDGPYSSQIDITTLPWAAVLVEGFPEEHADSEGRASISASTSAIPPTLVAISRLPDGAEGEPWEATAQLDVWGPDDLGIAPRRGEENVVHVLLDGPRGRWGEHSGQAVFDPATMAITLSMRARSDANVVIDGQPIDASGADRSVRIECRRVAAAIPLVRGAETPQLTVPVVAGRSTRNLTLSLPPTVTDGALAALASGAPLCGADGGLAPRSGPRVNAWIESSIGPDSALGEEGATLADADVIVYVLPGARVGERRCGPYGMTTGFHVTQTLYGTHVRAVDPRTAATLATAELNERDGGFGCPVTVRSGEGAPSDYLGDVRGWVRENVLTAR